MANVTPPGVPADWGNNPIPRGVYDLVVHDTNYLRSKSGNSMILFTFKVVGHECAGKLITDYKLIPHDPNYEHYEMMWGQFNAFMESCGMASGTTFPVPDYYGDKNNPQRVEFFHGATTRAFVGIEEQEGYDPKNVIKNHKKPEANGAPAGVPGGAPQTNQVGFPSEASGMEDVPFS